MCPVDSFKKWDSFTQLWLCQVVPIFLMEATWKVVIVSDSCFSLNMSVCLSSTFQMKFTFCEMKMQLFLVPCCCFLPKWGKEGLVLSSVGSLWDLKSCIPQVKLVWVSNHRLWVWMSNAEDFSCLEYFCIDKVGNHHMIVTIIIIKYCLF